ncbi:MAG: hypothetical protein WC855_04715 [Thermodesulfovibrionales bacterium]
MNQFMLKPQNRSSAMNTVMPMKMTNRQLETPVAFLVFNRPDATARVFEAIRAARPPRLLVVADGPRVDRPGDTEKCQATRAILQRVDWPCEVLTNYSDVNLGCKGRVSSGLDWVFRNVEEAIILEDDCLPHPTFFRFCEELLEKYRDDERVMMISGDNFQFGNKRTPYSYYFSHFTHIWGWASWRRAWKYYDVNMKLWPEIRDHGWLYDVMGNARSAEYWSGIFNKVYDNKINTWDYQWTFACWVQNGLTVLPNNNLISNIGFYHEATHTSTIISPFANMETKPMIFPLSHPPYMIRDSVADSYTTKRMFLLPSLLFRVMNKMRRFLK